MVKSGLSDELIITAIKSKGKPFDLSTAEIIELKFFCGLSFAEIAAMRRTSERTIQRSWEKGRLYLHHAIGDAGSSNLTRHAAARR